ncbi:MAG: hypothetical protein WKF85_02865 [Chitinophagaceae bacterium]
MSYLTDDFIIYTVNKEEFDEGERDPFKFDDIVEKISDKYFPFSGTIAKPIYFIFVSFVNRFLQEKEFVGKTKKQNSEIKIKLEKLLVYCWKYKTLNLRSQRIIGNRFSKQDIEPLTSNNWVKQTSFKIYTTPDTFSKTSEFYWQQIGIKQIDLLKEFLIINKSSPSADKELQLIVKQLMARRKSIFANHLLETNLKKRFLIELRNALVKRNTKYLAYVSEFFNHLPDNSEQFWKQTLENPELPFLYLNRWFSTVVQAVNDDVSSNPTSAWNKANKAFDTLKKFNPYLKIDRTPNRGNWFEFKNGKYQFTDKLKGNEEIWRKYMSRQGEVDANIRFFYSFRHYAFKHLLQELTYSGKEI